MIIGNGLIANALIDYRTTVFHAAGVANSGCTEKAEFDRDTERLKSTLDTNGLLVYFGTTSDAQNRYTEHKLACEELVKARGNYLICRLPIVAGRTENQYTLLNWIRNRLRNGEEIECWMNARRNIIDVMDVSSIVSWLIDTGSKDETINVAAPMSYPVRTIIDTMARIVDRKAIVRKVNEGTAQKIDVTRIAAAPVTWSDDYLEETLAWYYA